ncbi:MAG: EthD family reductase [Casimicrobiaceae bacterium]
MAKVYAMYKTPTDPAAFEHYYFDRHVPLAKTIPGLRGYEVTRGPIAAMAGPAPYHLIATLTFDSRAAIDAALVSAQGQAIAADLGNFATGGVDVLIADKAVV